MKYLLLSMLPLFLLASHAVAQDSPSTKSPTAADLAEDWYFPAWLGTAPHAPVFQVRDTENKYGRYAGQTKSITIKDLIKFHGHFCGGLVESAAALRVAFDRLFADGVIDRTDLRIASNNSACGDEEDRVWHVRAERHRSLPGASVGLRQADGQRPSRGIILSRGDTKLRMAGGIVQGSGQTEGQRLQKCAGALSTAAFYRRQGDTIHEA